MNSTCDSQIWDFISLWHSESFHFSQCFQITILVWIPCAFLWIFLPLEVYHQKKSQSRNIPLKSHNFIKLLCIGIAAALQFTNSIHGYFIRNEESQVYYYSCLMNSATFILLFILTFMNMKRGIRWSGIAFFFSLLSVACGWPMFSTILSNWDSKIEVFSEENMKQLSHILHYFLIVIIFALNCFVDEEPRYFENTLSKTTYPSEKASFFSKAFFIWFEPYIWKNYNKPVKNYFWDLDSEDSATEILRNNEFLQPISIRKKLFQKYKSSYWYCLLLRTIYEICGLLVYVLFYYQLYLFEMETQSWKKYLFCMAFSFCLFIQTIAISEYLRISARLEIRVKGSIQSSLYSKGLRISNEARRNYTASDIVNLISIDVAKVQNIIQETHILFSQFIQMVFACIFLWYILGPTAAVDIFTIIIIVWVSYYISAFMKKLQLQEMKNKDTRGKLMQEIFMGIKVLKMYAWELSFKKVALELRSKENIVLNRIGYINTAFKVLFVNSPYMLCLFGFAAYVSTNVHNQLDVKIAFVSMALFNSFRIQFLNIPAVFLSLQQFFISCERIDKFLNSEELKEEIISHEPIAESLVMKNATFFWNCQDGRLTLENLNIRINKGSLVAIVGPVGSGKSSLIAAFLGEMYKISGFVNTNGTIAYVPQQAWILNTSIKENITMNEPLNLNLYEKCIEVCALQADLQDLPAADMTEIGEKGVNLSGGQKQRVSLARAVYRDADIYFFDDPLSAVDSPVANHLFSKVLGRNGILEKKTRVLVTHNVKFLPFMDQIIVLNNGRISECGTYEELLDLDDNFAQFLHIHSEQKKTQEEECQYHRHDKKIVHKDSYCQKSKSDLSHDQEIKKKASHKLIKEEQIQTKKINKKIYWTYISAAGVALMSIVILFTTFNQTVSVFSNVWLSFWMSRGSTNTEEFVFIYLAFGVAQILITILDHTILFYGTIKASTYFYEKLLNNVLRWPMSSFDSTPIGRIISRFGDDIYVLDNVINIKISLVLILIARYISIPLLAVCIVPLSFVIIIPTFLIFLVIKKLYDGLSHQLKRIESANKAPLYSHAVESITGVQSIRAYGFQEKFIFQFKKKINECSAIYHSNSSCAAWLGSRCELLGGLFIFFTSILCAIELDSVSLAEVALIMMTTLQVHKGLRFTIMNIGFVEDGIMSVERINEYINYPMEPPPEQSSLDIPKNWPSHGEIIFHEYQLRYRDDLDLVLKDLTFKIQPKEKIGIIGRTGAGKTSITLGLFRIVEPAGGIILIDNVDITSVGLHKLRSKLTVIPQDPILFSGTLRFNLDPSHNYNDDYLWNILEKSHLKSFVQTLPGGLRHNIEEGGRNISFGQRQLICLARALLRKSKILVLDEATASVDIKTDELIQKTIRKEFSDSTVITIAHRLNTLQDYDKILILEGGRMIDFDTKENLLKSKNSRLREMMTEMGVKN